jgi:peptide/nickel transport system permease protein
MTNYLVQRLLQSIVVLLGVTIIVSGMLHISGDPVAVILESGIASEAEREELRHELGLDRPFILQYVDFIKGAMVGDLGTSLRFKQPALDLVLERLPATLQLALAAMLISVVVAIPVGILSAARPHSALDHAGRLLALSGQSIPLFWLGIMFVMVFSVRLGWLPAAGRLEPTSIILPALTLGLYPMARIARTLRASMLEVLVMDYCQTARAKGLSERKVVLGHAVRNAALPVVTVMGLQFGYLLGGAVVTETIFAWPGLGWLSVQAVGARDFPLVRAIVAVVALMLTLLNLLTDLFYAYINPQIRYD